MQKISFGRVHTVGVKRPARLPKKPLRFVLKEKKKHKHKRKKKHHKYKK